MNPSQVPEGDGVGFGVGDGVGFGVGVGVGAGAGPSEMTMSAHESQTWSVSSQSHLQPSTYSPGVFGTFNSSMTLNLLGPG